MRVLSVLISDSLCLSRLWEPVLLKKEKTNYAGWSLRSVIKKCISALFFYLEINLIVF